MSTLHLVGLSGSTRRPSRTTHLVEMIGRQVGQRRATTFTSFDLVSAGPGLGAFTRADLTPEATSVLAAVEDADALIVGTPIYKGSYVGLLKHLIDFIDPKALAGKPVIVAATGGGRRHALVVEHAMRPLFGFFSALTMPTSIYASDEDFRDGVLADPVTLERVAAAASEMATLAPFSCRQAPLSQVA